MKRAVDGLKEAWSASVFPTPEVTGYARKLAADEARRGLMVLAVIMLCLCLVEAVLLSRSGLGANALYTCLLLALLSVHVLVSARAIEDARTLYLLGTALLIISGVALVLLAHNAGAFNFPLFASVTLLFMVVPVVPWGMKEALLVLALVYGTFTASTWSAGRHFDSQMLWSLQFIMLGAGTISLALVIHNTWIRKADIRARFDLEQVNRKMLYLSNKDPLTGAWNRRFLKHEYDKRTRAWHAAGQSYHFAFVDIDDFKPMNDNCGHDYGDEVLRTVARVFTRAVGEEGYFVRMGGDEFAVLFSREAPQDLLVDAWQSLNAAMPAVRDCAVLPIGLSIGLVSVQPGQFLSLEELTREADRVLYQAKDRKEQHRHRANIVATDLPSPAKRQGTVA
jgi:diguanylate cyclase (GGDEF)-like protein